MALTVKVVENKPRVFVVALAGSLDSTTYAALEKKIDYLLAEGEAKVLTLDLADFVTARITAEQYRARTNTAP